MSECCPACGAMLSEENTCQAIRDALLNFEYTNAVPHSIHFLMVTGFMIRHGRYSNEALVWAQSMLQPS